MASMEDVDFQQKVKRLERMSSQMSMIASELTGAAEQKIEAAAGEQFPIDANLDSIKDNDKALDLITSDGGDVVFGRLVRAVEALCSDEESKKQLLLNLIDIRIENISNGEAHEKHCSFSDGTFTYHGAFHHGSAGCLSEELLRQELEVAIGVRDEVDPGLVAEEYEREAPPPPLPEDEPPPLPTNPRPQIGRKLPPVKAEDVDEAVVESSLSPLQSPRAKESTPLVERHGEPENQGGCCVLL